MFKENKNFDIKEMINAFSFEDLIKRNYISAVLLFTDNQYVASYTENYGKGLHNATLVRIYKDIHGGGYINSDSEYEYIKKHLNDYINAKIFFYKDKINIFFDGLDNLNYKNYNSFLTFLDDFNDILTIITKNKNIQISFFNKDLKIYITTNSFNIVSKYFKEHITNSVQEIDYKQEIIIGVPTNNKFKHKK